MVIYTKQTLAPIIKMSAQKERGLHLYREREGERERECQKKSYQNVSKTVGLLGRAQVPSERQTDHFEATSSSSGSSSYLTEKGIYKLFYNSLFIGSKIQR